MIETLRLEDPNKIAKEAGRTTKITAAIDKDIQHRLINIIITVTTVLSNSLFMVA